jgi:leucyl aminopeptidase
MHDDRLLIDIVHKKDLKISTRDTIVNMVTREGLGEALELKDRFSVCQLNMLAHARTLGTFNGNSDHILLHIPDDNDSHVHVFVGLGSRKNLNSRVFRNAGAGLAGRVAKLNINSMVLDLSLRANLEPFSSIKPFVEGIAIGSYTFSKYFREKKPFPLGKLTVVVPDYMNRDDARKSMTDAALNVQASNISRHLTNESSNNKTPELFEALIYENLVGANLDLHTMLDDELQNEKLNLLRAVGQAGSARPRMLVMEDIRLDRSFCLGIVGKAVTFDAGGLMLKSPESLPYMRDDVAGAASVIGLMSVLRDLNLDFNVVCAIPIAENMLDAKAYRPADVFDTRWNLSVEVTNTDSEGRLIMADAFMYLQDTYQLNALIDVATLTGAVARALGNKMSGFFTTDDRMRILLDQAQTRSCEKFWQLPLEQSYRSLLKSAFADVKNEGGEPKAVSAALFLETFVKNDLPWLHLDLGSVISPGMDDPLYGNPEYTTGIPAITLVEFLRLLNKNLNLFSN